MNDTSDLGTSVMTIRYKMVFVGDVFVGKTSIMNRFISGDYKEAYDPTIGVDFATKTIEYKENSIKLQFWDSAGQERYKALIPSYVRGSSVVFIVYDISKKSTFLNLNTWINFIKQVNTDNALLVLCGNKIDLPREVQYNEGKELADKEKLLFFETSARNSENINKMFYTCICELPFFTQLEITNKDALIKELENNNMNVEQNSIYDIVKNNNKDKSNNKDNTPGLVVNGVQHNQEKESHKKKCPC